jgi:hypothetical protein
MRELCGACDVNGNRGAGIGNRFCLEFAFLYLEIVLQHVGVAGKAGDPAIGVLKYDQVKLSTPPGISPATWPIRPSRANCSSNPGVIR